MIEVTSKARLTRGRVKAVVNHWHPVQRVAVMYAGKIVEEAPVEQLFARPSHPYHAGADPLDSTH